MCVVCECVSACEASASVVCVCVCECACVCVCGVCVSVRVCFFYIRFLFTVFFKQTLIIRQFEKTVYVKLYIVYYIYLLSSIS